MNWLLNQFWSRLWFKGSLKVFEKVQFSILIKILNWSWFSIVVETSAQMTWIGSFQRFLFRLWFKVFRKVLEEWIKSVLVQFWSKSNQSLTKTLIKSLIKNKFKILKRFLSKLWSKVWSKSWIDSHSNCDQSLELVVESVMIKVLNKVLNWFWSKDSLKRLSWINSVQSSILKSIEDSNIRFLKESDWVCL